MALMNIEIRKVETGRDLKKFINFQYELYEGNKFWCPPPRFDEYNTLHKKKNPAFAYCEAEYWIAYRGNKRVGRVAGIINHRANQRWNHLQVRFGWIDFIDDPAVSEALILTVTDWGKEHGMTGIHGPLGFTDMDPEGMLVEGFDEYSSLSAIYNYPYYPLHMEHMGFTKAVDWIQFMIRVPSEIPDKISRTAAWVAEKYGLRMIRAKRSKELLPWARKMFEMQNQAFNDLYGYAALSEAQMDLYTKQYFGFIRPEFVSFVADRNDDIVAFGVTIPELTKALQKANGRLFPFGFIHLLKALRHNDTIHMYLIGVRPDYQGRGALAMIYHDLHKAFLDHGIAITTTHAQLEENFKAISIWKNYENRIYVRRRCFAKEF
jgi:hypothetical protein